MKKLYNWGKGKVQKISQSKYKHVAGFLAFVMVIGLFGGFDGIGRGISSSYDDMSAVHGDMYAAYKPSIFDTATDSIFNAVSGMGGMKSESAAIDREYDYSANYAPEAPESPVVYENDYLTTDNTAYQNQTEKLIYSANLDIETKDIDYALEEIYARIKEYGGIIQDERQNNMGNVVYDDYYRHMGTANAYIYVRVPQENYEDFINSIEDKDGNIIISDISKSVQNMTKQYYDTESRLRSLRIQEERLFDFMESAKSVSEMLDVEDRLTDVQYEIDSATNSLATIDNDVKYSKVSLNISEVVKYTDKPENPKNFFERVWSYIKGSADNFTDTLEYWLEIAIYMIPYVFVLVLLYFGFIKIKRKVQKKRKEKKEKKENQENNE